MKTTIFRFVVTSILLLGLAIPGAAFAGGGGKGCSIQGTWFGVDSLEDLQPTGWVVTTTGRSNDRGVNVLEFPTFDFTFGGAFSEVVDGSANRGVWRRLDGNRFAYSFTAIAVDADNNLVYTARVSGTSTISHHCMFETITAYMEIFVAGQSMFKDDPYMEFPLPEHYGYRYTLD